MHAFVARHVAYVDGGVVAAIAAYDFVVHVAAHVAVVLGLEQGGVRAQRALAHIRIGGDAMLLEAVLFVVVHVLERAHAVLAQMSGRREGRRWRRRRRRCRRRR